MPTSKTNAELSSDGFRFTIIVHGPSACQQALERDRKAANDWGEPKTRALTTLNACRHRE